MLIGGQMGWRKSNFFILLVIMLCASLVVSLEYRRTAEEVFLSRLVDPATGEINEDLAEQLWISCRPDFQLLTEANEDHNLCFAEETSGRTNNLKGCSLSKETIPKFIKVLQPQSKQTLLDCIRKNSILFPFSVENGGFDSHRHGKYVDSFNVRPVVPKRNLLQSATPPDSPAEPPSSSPAVSPDEAPPPVSASPNRSPPPRKPFFPRGGFDESPPAPSENVSAPPISGADVEPDNGNSNHRSIVIAVVLTASVTFVFAALFFFCCTKLFRRHGGVGQNDERPLLSLSLSDYSAGSSHKSFGYGNSVTEENGSQWNNNLYSKSDSLPAIDEAQALGSVGVPAKTFTESVDTSSNVNGLLPPPPGRSGSTLKPPPGREGSTLKPPPGREGSTLKPPPGRADPLPPEPPAALRPPSSRTGPPPPPPVPPAVKVSGSTGAPPPGPPPPPMAPRIKPGAPPPPPLKGGPRPPPPIPSGSKIPRPPTAKLPGDDDPDHSKAKLKPFFWDKVLANPDHSMVWHQIKSGSFQFNEEMIETLFGYTNDKNKNDLKKDPSQDASSQYIQIINPKKAQNLSILLRALNVTIEEVCDALDEGNELPVELLQTLLKMAPTADEELKLRLYCGDLSQLGPAERFLKALVDIPFAFKRLEALLFMCTLEEEVTTTKESFGILEVACKELRSSRLFLKLLEAVLKTGNRMNVGTFRGGAQAFKLDTLLKLSDVKGTDGKTTLLHFVVQEIIRSEGVRAARAAKASRTLSGVSVKTEDLLEEISPDTEDHFRDLGLQVVSRLSSELENVKKAAIIDADSLTGTVAKLGHSLLKTRDFLNKEMNSLEEDGGFQEVLKSSVQNAEVDVTLLLEEEKRIMALVKSTGDYFHGNAGKDEGLRLFVIVRDFLIMLDKVCKEVGEAQKKSAKALKKEASTASAHSDTRQQPSPDVRSRLFPAIAERRMDNSSSSSSSDDES